MSTQPTSDTAAVTTPLLTAAPNFRHPQGLQAVDGRRLRMGRLFRSGALDELSAEDLAVLGGLGIGLCFDLRSRGEREKHPSRWPAEGAPRILAIEVATDIRAFDREAGQYLIDHPDAEGAAHLMRAIYRNMPRSCAPVLQALFAELLAPAAAPTVIHCTAGKDRTGFVVALLLSALGVPMQAIETDYLETNHYYDPARQDEKIRLILQELFGLRLDGEALRAITAARLDYLAAAFETIQRDWGSVEHYLEVCGGLDDGKRERLRDRLLD